MKPEHAGSNGLPHRSARSAPALRFSRQASLNPLRSRIQDCFSPSRYLLEPLQVLRVEATSYRAGFAPAGINTPFHGTQSDARNKRDQTAAYPELSNLAGVVQRKAAEAF